MEWIPFPNENNKQFSEERQQYLQRIKRKMSMSRICTVNHTQRNEEACKNRDRIILERKMLVHFNLAIVTYRFRVWTTQRDYRERLLKMLEENNKKVLKLNSQGFISGSNDMQGLSGYLYESFSKHPLYPSKCYTERLDNVSCIYAGLSGIYFVMEFQNKKLKKAPILSFKKLKTKTYNTIMEEAERRRDTINKEKKISLKSHLEHVKDVVNRLSKDNDWIYMPSGCARMFNIDNIGFVAKSKSTDLLEKFMRSYKLERDINDTQGELCVVNIAKYRQDNDSFGVNTLPTHNQLHDSLEVRLQRATLRRDLHLKYRTIKAHSMALGSQYRRHDKIESVTDSRRSQQLSIEITSPGQLSISAKSPPSPSMRPFIMGRRSGYITSPAHRHRGARGFSDV